MATNSALLKNVEIYYPRLDPKRPIVIQEGEDGEEDKMGWEVTLRTTNKNQAKAWKDIVGSKMVKAIREDKDDEESDIMYWQLRLRKKQTKANGEEAEPVEVVRCDTLEALDPKIIGNGSKGDVRIFQYDYSFKQKGQLVEGLASMLTGIKIKKLKKYTAAAREEFEAEDGFEVEDENGNVVSNEDDGTFGGKDEPEEQPKKGTRKSKPKAAPKQENIDDEIPF